jgi:ATP-dependent Clp protease ATP-binding subunit ClpA
VLSEAAIEQLALVGYDSKMGARPLGRKINELIKVPLSKKILFENIEPNTIIDVDYNNEKFVFNSKTHNLKPSVNADGYVVLE